MKIDYASLAILVTALGAAIVNIIVAVKNSNKIDVVSDKVDGTATAQVTKIESLQHQLTELRAILASKDQIAAVAAANATVRKAVVDGDKS